MVTVCLRRRTWIWLDLHVRNAPRQNRGNYRGMHRVRQPSLWAAQRTVYNSKHIFHADLHHHPTQYPASHHSEGMELTSTFNPLVYDKINAVTVTKTPAPNWLHATQIAVVICIFAFRCLIIRQWIQKGRYCYSWLATPYNPAGVSLKLCTW